MNLFFKNVHTLFALATSKCLNANIPEIKKNNGTWNEFNICKNKQLTCPIIPKSAICRQTMVIMAIPFSASRYHIRLLFSICTSNFVQEIVISSTIAFPRDFFIAFLTHYNPQIHLFFCFS